MESIEMFRFAQHDNGYFCVCYFLSLRASPSGERGNQQARNPHDSSLIYGWLLRLSPRNDNWNLGMLSEEKHLFQIPSCFGFPLVFIFNLWFYSWLFSSRGTGGLLACTPHYIFESQMVCICYPFVALRQTLLWPPTPARFSTDCAPHGLCHAPQRFVYVKMRT